MTHRTMSERSTSELRPAHLRKNRVIDNLAKLTQKKNANPPNVRELEG